MIETEGVADGEHALTDEQLGALSDGQCDEFFFGCADAQNGEIFFRRFADDGGFPLGLIGERDVEDGALSDHVEVRDDVSLIVPDDGCEVRRRSRFRPCLGRKFDGRCVVE